MWIDDLVSFAQAQLTDRERTVLYGRGVTDEQIEHFGLGYIDRKLPSLEGEGVQDFLEWAVQGARLDDMFLFPLTTIQGAVTGVQFRHVDRKKKGYTDFFLRQDEPCLFGLGQSMPHVWEKQEAMLVEGAFDLFPLQRHFPAIFATMTAKVTAPVARMLRRLVPSVLLGYDMDARGRKATQEFIRTYGEQFPKVRVVSYPRIYQPGTREFIKDPGDLWEAWGDERVGAFLRSTINEE